jgi:hypothetical protein
MIWFVIGHILTIIISLIRFSRFSENDKDIEILILRHQLDVMVRKQNQPVRLNRAEKTILAVLTVQLKQATKHTGSTPLHQPAPTRGLNRFTRRICFQCCFSPMCWVKRLAPSPLQEEGKLNPLPGPAGEL